MSKLLAVSLFPALIWEHGPLQDVPSPQGETGFPSLCVRSGSIVPWRGPSWNSRNSEALADGHFESMWLGSCSGGAFPIFKEDKSSDKNVGDLPQRREQNCELPKSRDHESLFAALATSTTPDKQLGPHCCQWIHAFIHCWTNIYKAPALCHCPRCREVAVNSAKAWSLEELTI